MLVKIDLNGDCASVYNWFFCALTSSWLICFAGLKLPVEMSSNAEGVYPIGGMAFFGLWEGSKA